MKTAPTFIVGFMAGATALTTLAPPVQSAIPQSTVNRARQQQENRSREKANVSVRRESVGRVGGSSSIMSGQRDSRSSVNYRNAQQGSGPASPFQRQPSIFQGGRQTGEPRFPTANRPGLTGNPVVNRTNPQPVQGNTAPNRVLGSTGRTQSILGSSSNPAPRRTSPVLGSPLGVPSQGQIPVNRIPEGLTPTGHALGAPVVRYPRSSPRIDRLDDVRMTEPVFWYNPITGQYERRHNRRGSVHVNVLLGTTAPRPIHRFSWGGSTHYLFYPYYCHNTVDYGYPVYPSPYYYYGGYWPAYIPSTRVIVVDRPVYIERGQRDYEGDYYLDRPVDQDIETALNEIRRAWMLGDIDLLLRHVRSDAEIAVYLKGKYTYSLPASDYRDLTQDAMKNSTTTGFRWIGLDSRSDDERIAKAEHTFTDQDGEKRTVFVSFTMVRIHGAWWIAEVGSSNNRNLL